MFLNCSIKLGNINYTSINNIISQVYGINIFTFGRGVQQAYSFLRGKASVMNHRDVVIVGH